MPYYVPDHLRSLSPRSRHRGVSVINKSLHTDFPYGDRRPRTPPYPSLLSFFFYLFLLFS